MEREDWAKAYFLQASSDWAIFKEFNGRDDVPRAQALHYLQMTTEKLAKAYRLRDSLTNLETILTSHVGFPEFFNTFLRSPSMREEFRGTRSYAKYSGTASRSPGRSSSLRRLWTV